MCCKMQKKYVKYFASDNVYHEFHNKVVFLLVGNHGKHPEFSDVDERSKLPIEISSFERRLRFFCNKYFSIPNFSKSSNLKYNWYNPSFQISYSFWQPIDYMKYVQ